MTLCNCKCSCALLSGVVSLILGVIAAFLQITGTIAIGSMILMAAAIVALVYLGILLLVSAIEQQCQRCSCTCTAVNALLAGALGTILFAVVLLVADVAAASVIGSILTGLLAASFALLVTSSACVIRNLFDCDT